MNNNLIFTCLTLASLILSLICIYIAPIINNLSHDFDSWGNRNCQLMKDQYDAMKLHNSYSSLFIDVFKKGKKNCEKSNAIYGLEYTAFIVDISVGFATFLLASLHFLGEGKSSEQFTGLIALIAGAISAILTLVYAGYSIDIFINYPIVEEQYFASFISNFTYNSIRNDLLKVYSNGAQYKWDGTKYVENYDSIKILTDPYIQFIKFKDYGKKQYNFNSKLYKALYGDDEYTEEKNCTIPSITGSIIPNSRISPYQNIYCDYLWLKGTEPKNSDKKYLYNRWVTTIVFSFFIILCNLGYALFGFFFFHPIGSGS